LTRKLSVSCAFFRAPLQFWFSQPVFDADCSRHATSIHATLAVVLDLIVVASCTSSVVHHSAGLQAVRQDDIGIHGTYVQVINVGLFDTLGIVTKVLEFFNNPLRPVVTRCIHGKCH
jgi:hypothetical protein